jgi:hypothetical protein
MSATAPLERKHIPLLPPYILLIRIIQLLLGSTLLGLAAYGISVYSTSGLGLTIFTVHPLPFPMSLYAFFCVSSIANKRKAVVTLISTLYSLITTHKLLVAYNYWAIIALDIFLIVFWLISFAKGAAEANHYRWLSDFDGWAGVGQSRTWWNTLVADAVLGADQLCVCSPSPLSGVGFGDTNSNSVLYVLSFLVMLYYVNKHRNAGGHCVPYSRQPSVELERQQHVDQSIQAEQYNRQPPAPPSGNAP